MGGKRVHNWIAEEDMQGTRGEPEPYDAWLLVDYPLNGPEHLTTPTK
jgi:hypothetical protein